MDFRSWIDSLPVRPLAPAEDWTTRFLKMNSTSTDPKSPEYVHAKCNMLLKFVDTYHREEGDDLFRQMFEAKLDEIRDFFENLDKITKK